MTGPVAPQIVAHRGWWHSRHEQNTLVAFERALDAGFGIETDLWWRDGEVVVSHDPPHGTGLPLEALVSCCTAHRIRGPLALNAKCDALSGLDRRLLAPLPAGSWFFFDMSVPDTLAYRAAGLPFFTRQSEHEPAPALYSDSAGVWLDQFESDWVDGGTLARHAAAGKAMCIVSPELHGRPFEPAWARYREALAAFAYPSARVMLCTDHPQQAREYFAA